MRPTSTTVIACALLALFAAHPTAARAAERSDAWCAESVDFAMRTVERREQGKSHDDISASIRKDFVVFSQQYPELSQDDMQEIVRKVFVRQYTRFGAANVLIDACLLARRKSTAMRAGTPAPAA